MKNTSENKSVFRGRTFFWILSLAWGCAVVCGMMLVNGYSNVSGLIGNQPNDLPSEFREQWKSNRFLVLMFVHPKCPCSRSSLRELARTSARCGTRIDVRIFVYRPEDETNSWVQTKLWRFAKAIPNAKVTIDVAGTTADRLGAKTSGHVLLYSPKGKLLFGGGITSARGHDGDNLGKRTIISLIEGGGSESSENPVFGCPIKVPIQNIEDE